MASIWINRVTFIEVDHANFISFFIIQERMDQYATSCTVFMESNTNILTLHYFNLTASITNHQFVIFNVIQIFSKNYERSF